jgi:DNA-directed RNA polymerase specialized sigma24 family protein
VDAAGIFIRSNDPFSGAENYQVMLVDIATAWERLSEGQRRLLRAYYSCNQEDTEDGRWERDGLAASMGLTGNALRVRVHRALERLQQELGGADPWRN